MRSSVVALVSAALLGALAACEPVPENHGNLPQPERLAQIAPGRTKSDVVALIGTPSTSFTLGGERWYYISNRTQEFAFYPIEELARQVIVIEFDKTGIVTRVRRLTLADGQDVSMIDRTTPAAGGEVSLFQQFLGNIGRFNAGGTEGVSK